MDIIALSSRNEGTPVSLIEAQAAGRPVVSTRTGGIADVVDEGNNALLSEVGNSETFAANLLRLVEDKALRERMAAVSKQGLERFQYQRLVADMRGLYENLLNRHG
jgi:glycosyltransferase involved in cell wall biosynthesis